MILKSEKDIAKLVESDNWMMDVLKAAEKLNLPNWWIGAGFLHNRVWDAIEDNDRSKVKDVDLVYYNVNNVNPKTDWSYDESMKKNYPFADWEVRNQARMHYVNGFDPYTSTEDGISHWVETATCVAVRLENDKLKFLFCYGLDDLLGLVARPIQAFRTPELIKTFEERVRNKKWQQKWPNIKVANE